MRILHVVPGLDEVGNGISVAARLIANEQGADLVEARLFASGKCDASQYDEVWVHSAWSPMVLRSCRRVLKLGKRLVRMAHAKYDPVRLRYHGWKKTLAGPIERFFLRRAKALVATCEAEKGWIESYLGRRHPPIEVTDLKRFFKLSGEVSTQSRRVAEYAESDVRLPSADGGLGQRPRDNSASSRLCVNNKNQDVPLHLLYLGRRHPLKGLFYLESALTTYYNMWSKSSASPTPTNACTAHPSGNPSIEPSNTTYYNKCPIDLRVVSSAFGDELEKVWDWCDVLVLPTLSENFGLVIAEALERGKRVITTDGAPAWECECKVEKCKVGSADAIWQGYDGRLIYLKGYRTGTPEDRIRLLQSAIENLLCPDSLTPPASHASLTSPAVK